MFILNYIMVSIICNNLSMLDQTNQSTIVSNSQIISLLKQELERLTKQKQSAYSRYIQLHKKIDNTKEQLRRYMQDQLQQSLPNSHRLADLERQQLQNPRILYLGRTQPHLVEINVQNCLKTCPSHMKRMTLICMSCQISICQVCAKNNCLSHKVYPQCQGLKMKSREIKQKYTTIIANQRQKLLQVQGKIKAEMMRKRQKARKQFSYLIEKIIDKNTQITAQYECNLKELLMGITRQKNLLNFIDQNFNGHTFQRQIFAFKDMNDLMILQASLEFGLNSFKKEGQYNHKRRNLLASKELDKTNFSKIQEEISKIKVKFVKFSIEKKQKSKRSIKVDKNQLKSAKSLSHSTFKPNKKFS